MTEDKERFLETLRRAEAIAERIAKDACRDVDRGTPAALEAARRALEIHQRAQELRRQAEEELKATRTQNGSDEAG